MSFVVYHKDTTRYLTNHRGVVTDKTSFATMAAAKAGLTREVNRGVVKAEDFLIADKFTFHDSIEKDVEVTAKLSGMKVTIKANTPLCCDPSSDTYASM